MNLSIDQPIRYQREYFCLRLCKLLSSMRKYTSTKVFIHQNPWTLPLCLPDIYSSYLYSFPILARTNHHKPSDFEQWNFILSQLWMPQVQYQDVGRVAYSRGGSQGDPLPLHASGDSRHWPVAPPCNLCLPLPTAFISVYFLFCLL